ncbi:MAG: hypothetical protein ACI4SK_04455 [Christensenellales bacterium]
MKNLSGVSIVYLATAISAELEKSFDRAELSKIRTLLGLICQNLSIIINQ